MIVLDRTERLLIEWECAQNTVRFYNRLDAVRGAEAAKCFADDGIWYREGDESGFTGHAEIADHVLVIPDTHYGRVEDAQMTVCHMLCYAFMERAVEPGERP